VFFKSCSFEQLFLFFIGNIKRKANLYESLKGGEAKKKWL